MALDPNRWTLKTQEAFTAAVEPARAASNPEVTPDHLLAALLGQEEGVVLPDPRRRSGVDAAARCATAADERLGQAAQGLRRPRPAWAATLPRRPRRGRRGPRRAATTSTSRPSTCCSPWPTASASPARSCSTALAGGAGQPPGHQPEPRGAVPGAREVRPRPHRGRPPGQARPGHRPRRGDPPRHPGAVPPHQEQPGAHRRARRRQDRHRRGPRPAHRRGRRARGPEEQAAHRARPRRRWSPAPSTAASSRSGSRPCSRRSPTPRARSSPSSTRCTPIVGAGAAEGAMDAGNMLKPMLARGELRMIGATTLDEYRKHIEKDAALERRFQQVFVGQPSVEDTIAILRGPQGALRGPPRRAHPGRRAGRRRRAVRPLPHRPLPARQGHRPRRRGRRQAAHRDRLDADRDRRRRAPHPPARDRAGGAGQGDRRRVGGAARRPRRGAGQPAASSSAA